VSAARIPDGTPDADPDDAAVLIDYWGGLAYGAYFQSCRGKNIHGEDLPPWANQDEAIRAHWFAAARAVKQVAEDVELWKLG
jgi:hypothetical protein